MPELTPGELLAGCRVEGVIARGGMGVVYRAVQLDLQRPVALKVITADRAGDPEFRERFARESRMAAAIDHPNVVPVYAAGEERGALYIVMRYVPGRDLHALIKDDGPLPAQRAAAIVAQVAAALDVAHAAGLVHRDVKPANVLLAAGSGDHAYLSDFGLMRTLDPLEPLTDSGSWIGTVDFASPEQLAGDRVDARSDVYSLGCVLYAALTGVPPFPRETVPATLLAHLRDPIPKPSATGASHYFDRIVARALGKEPEERYPSAGDLGRAALAAARGEPVTETERTVAIGSAAPGGVPASEVTAPTSIAPPQRLWSGQPPPAPPPPQPVRTAPPPAKPRAAVPGHTRARTARNAPASTPAAPAAPPAPPAPRAQSPSAGAAPAAPPSSPPSPSRSPASSPSPCSCSAATSARPPSRRPARSPKARSAPSPRPSPMPTRPRTVRPSAACSRATCAACCPTARSRAAKPSSPSTNRSFATTPRRATSSRTSRSPVASPAARAASTASGAPRAPRSRARSCSAWSATAAARGSR